MLSRTHVLFSKYVTVHVVKMLFCVYFSGQLLDRFSLNVIIFILAVSASSGYRELAMPRGGRKYTAGRSIIMGHGGQATVTPLSDGTDPTSLGLYCRAILVYEALLSCAMLRAPVWGVGGAGS